MQDLDRYSIINTHMKRELILLQGRGCVWKKCRFCDYFHDTSDNSYEVNKAVIDKITGIYGVVDVINSGSFFELDDKTKIYLKDKLNEKRIHTLWCECHWLYRNRLDEIRTFFNGITVKFRTGVETFDPLLRSSWNKGIDEHVTPSDVSKYFDGICLLVCVQGQSKESIIKDIETSLKYFEYFNVNVFNENSTEIKKDFNLEFWFVQHVLPTLSKLDNVEVLINNTDLGVG